MDRNTVLALIPLVAVLGKTIQLLFLPDRYLFDSNRMIAMLSGDGRMKSWSGYQTTVDIFKKINYFKLYTVTEWSICLGIIGTIFLIILISRCKEMNKMEAIYTLMAVGILNIYTFNIAKEPIQFAFFFMIEIIIILPINNTLIKMLGCSGIFLWESNTYRSYYILMAAMVLVFYIVFFLFRAVFKKINAVKIVLATIICFLAVFLFVFASQYYDKSSYNELIKAKENHQNEGAGTVLNNIVEGESNYNNCVVNYFINAVRMMVPIELLVKSPGYFPFFVYQIFILMYWFRTIKNIRKVNNKAFLSLVCFTAYLFGSFSFEPDFGSWVRHESAAFPVFYIMAYEDLSLKKEETIEYEEQTI